MIALVVLALTATAPPAASVPASAVDDAAKTEARAHYDAGKSHYDLGRFPDALAEFEKAYEAKPLPGLLFNIGQCHFQEKRYGRAVFFYERYLELVPEASNKQLVEDLIVEAKKLEAPAPPTTAAPTVAPPVAPAVVAPLDDGDSTLLYVGAGVGAAVVVIASVTAYAFYMATPAPGSLGIADRRAR